MSIMAPRRPLFPSAWEQSLEDQLIDARCIITDLEKRIAAFETHHEEKDALIIGLSRDAQCNAEDARAERQRREECEAALRLYADDAVEGLGAGAEARAYFSRYPSEPANRTKVVR